MNVAVNTVELYRLQGRERYVFEGYLRELGVSLDMDATLTLGNPGRRFSGKLTYNKLLGEVTVTNGREEFCIDPGDSLVVYK